MLEAAIDAGADDVKSSGENGHEVVTTAICSAPSPTRWRPSSANRARRGSYGSRTTPSPLTTSRARRCLKLIETLKEHDDVQNVYANFEISDALMAEAQRLAT